MLAPVMLVPVLRRGSSAVRTRSSSPSIGVNRFDRRAAVQQRGQARERSRVSALPW